MLKFIKQVPVLFISLVLVLPYSASSAEGEFCSMEEIKNSTSLTCSPHKKAIKHKKHKRKKHRHKHASAKIKETVITQEEVVVIRNYPKLYKQCLYTQEGILECKVLNPADIVDFNCKEMSEKLKTCEAYTCQAPYVQDPTVNTTWQILVKNGDRCVISNTTDNVGLKDKNNQTIPLTRTCEYDPRGISGLNEIFGDMQQRYFHYTDDQHHEGVHNCTFKSNGVSIQDIFTHP